MAQFEHVTRDGLMATIRADRARFDRIVEDVPRRRLAEPVLPGGWSVKDVLAHVAWGDREAARIVAARSLAAGSELWDRSEDERNEAVVREYRSWDGSEVIAECDAAFRAYVSAMETLSDDELNEPRRFDGLAERVPGWPPWRLLYDPGHLDDHGQAIQAALRSER